MESDACADDGPKTLSDAWRKGDWSPAGNVEGSPRFPYKRYVRMLPFGGERVWFPVLIDNFKEIVEGGVVKVSKDFFGYTIGTRNV